MIINTWFLSHQWCFLWISTINQCWGHDIEGIPLSTNVHEDTCKRSHPFQRWFLDGNTSRFLEIATNHFLGNICPFSSIFLGVLIHFWGPHFLVCAHWRCDPAATKQPKAIALVTVPLTSWPTSEKKPSIFHLIFGGGVKCVWKWGVYPLVVANWIGKMIIHQWI